jgi:hypothetical protein
VPRSLPRSRWNPAQSISIRFSRILLLLRNTGDRMPILFARIAHHSNPRQNEHKPRRERVITTVELLSTLYVIKSACIFIVTACSWRKPGGTRDVSPSALRSHRISPGEQGSKDPGTKIQRSGDRIGVDPSVETASKRDYFRGQILPKYSPSLRR